jgi:NAD(P)-dependent dehydrogenase (short-subunit alcohol dehydrogenase family)
VVTGGASGVGAALLDVLAELDAAHVTVLDRNVPIGPHDEHLQIDLANEAEIHDAIGRIEAPVHALFNNAGVADDTVAGTTVMAVNYLAVRSLSEGLLDSMPEGAAIVNTASLAGHGWPEQIMPITELLDLFDGPEGWDESLAWWEANAATLGRPYNFSKAAVQVYTMRASYPMHRRKVRINAICPGVIDTPLLEDFRRVSSDGVIDWAISEMGAASRPAGLQPRSRSSVCPRPTMSTASTSRWMRGSRPPASPARSRRPGRADGRSAAVDPLPQIADTASSSRHGGDLGHRVDRRAVAQFDRAACRTIVQDPCSSTSTKPTDS